MARLQILELPEGSGDDQPPFILVVDQVPRDEAGFDALRRDLSDDVAQRIGARAVLAFETTIDIPANDTSAYLPEAEAQAEPRRADERAIQAEEKLKAFMEKRYVIEQERKALLTDALGMDRTRDWDDIRNAAAGLRKSNEARAEAIDRVLALSYQPEIMDAQHAEPTGYQHGYRIAIQDAKRAVGYQSEHPTEKQSRA